MNVLALDDNRYILELLEMVITTANHSPILADRPSVASELLKSEPIDLIISDIRMPEMNGIEFGHLIRKQGIKTPIIYYSSEIGAKSIYARDFEEIGSVIFIDKDEPIPNLIKAIHDHEV